MSDPVAQFADACRNAGLDVHSLVMDGVLRRVPLIGERKRKLDGAYVGYLDGRAAGFFQNHKTGVKGTWRYDGEVSTASISHADIAARKAERERQRQAEADAAAETAVATLARAGAALADHPYLTSKQIKPHGLRVLDGDLLVPCFDAAGRIRSVQRIFPDGKKLFTKGSAVTGLYLILGDLAAKTPILVAEGFATAATLHELSGWPVVVTFNAGNLEPVARLVRDRFPRRRIVICGDDDHHRVPNVGREKATRAARAIRAWAIFPPSGPGVTDWNDHAVQAGFAAARNSLFAALEAALFNAIEKNDERKNG